MPNHAPIVVATILMMGMSAMTHAQTWKGAAVSAPQRAPAGHPGPARAARYPIYVVPVQPRDDRTARERCWDSEASRISGALSDLDRRTIDLKCSQR